MVYHESIQDSQKECRAELLDREASILTLEQSVKVFKKKRRREREPARERERAREIRERRERHVCTMRREGHREEEERMEG